MTDFFKDPKDSPEEAAYRLDVQKWLASNVPARPDFHLPNSFLEVGTEEQCEYLRSWQGTMYEAGYVGLEVPTEYGGQGGQNWQQKIVSAEFTRVWTPPLLNVVGIRMAMPTILHHGTEEQKKRFVKKILSAEEIWAQGFSEPNAGSDLASVQCWVERTPDGDFVASGHKIWTTLGQFGDWMILLARTDKDVPKHAGLSYFLMPMRDPGIEVRPLIKMTREATFNQCYIDGVKIPADCLLGELGQGWEVAMTTLLYERGAAGGDERSIRTVFAGTVHRLVDVAKRTRRGDGMAIDDPVVRDRLAAVAIESAAVPHHMSRARIEALTDYPMGIPLMSKLYGSELAMKLEEVGQEILGPATVQLPESEGSIEHGIWQLTHMNAYGPIIGGGTSEIQKNIIGQRVLGLAKG